MCSIAASAQTFNDGNFNYSIMTDESYGTYASLGSPTTSLRNSNPSSISIPGYVTYNGQKYRVQISLRALGDYANQLTNVSTIYLGYGVFYISYRAFSNLHKLQRVTIPSSVVYIGSEFLMNCGDNSSSSTLTVDWATLNPGNTTLASDAFASCGATLKKMNLPTLPSVSAAKSISNVTNYFSVNSTPSPTTCYDLSPDNRYFVATKAPTSSSYGELSLVGATGSSFSITSSPYLSSSTGYYFYINSVAEKACYGNTSLQSVSITNPNFTINSNAFAYCTNLTSANLSTSIIDTEAFYGCTNLSTITLNEGVQRIYSKAFEQAAITNLSLPASLLSIGVTAVNKCYNLTNFYVATGNNNYVSLSGALYSKDKTILYKVPANNNHPNTAGNFASELTTIYDYAFSDNRKATNVDIPYGVTKMGTSYGHLFENATSIYSVKIPSSVTSINYSYAFYGCSNLMKILVATYYNYSSVNSYTFQGTPSSMRVYVPSSRNDLTGDANAPFYATNYWKDHNVTYGAYDFVNNNIPYILNTWVDTQYKTAYVVYGTNIKNDSQADYTRRISGALTIPETITYRGTTYEVYAIGGHAFDGASNITSVTLNQIFFGSHGGCQFRNCTSLTQLTFNNKKAAKTPIPNQCFRNTRISTISLPYGISEIGDLAFADNPNLTYIKIPSSIETYYYNKFSYNSVRNCTSLETIIINKDSAPNMGIDDDKYVAPNNSTSGCFYNVPQSCKIYVPVGARTSFYNFKNNGGYYPWRYFNSIEAGASDWQDLTVIKENEDGSFNAKMVYIPNNTIQFFSISDDTYKWDQFSRRYYIKELSDSCFAGATQLGAVRITWSDNIIKKIPDYAFVNCTNLTSFTWPDKPCKLSYIGTGAFANSAIQGVVDLTKCNDTKLDIQDYAFGFTNNVTHFKLPANVDRIGEAAMFELFDAALTDVTCLATDPPTNLGEQVWNSFLQPGQTLHVPKGCYNKYMGAAQWQDFGDMDENALVGDVNCDGSVNAADVTALYNFILNGDETYLSTSDVNNDDAVNAGDVTAVYNIILGN